MLRFYGPVNPMGSCRAQLVYRDFPGPNLGPVMGPFPNQKIGEVSQFSVKNSQQMYENPNFTLAEMCDKICHMESHPFEREHVPSSQHAAAKL